MDAVPRVVIVGASVGGLTTAESLRHEGFEGHITVIGDEVHVPYSRPPLSKQVLTGEWTPDRAAMFVDDELHLLDLELLAGRRATGLADGAVLLGDERVPYDTLVIATGVTARRSAAPEGLVGVHVLRTLDDVVGLRADLEHARRVVVIGTGVLGSEIAAAARKLGLDVVLVGRTSQLRLGQVGPLLSPLLEKLHRDNGVDLRLGVDATRILGLTEATGVTGVTRVTGVELSDGSTVEADVVISAIGATPATGWLTHSGLDVSDGVLCDADGRAAPNIYAVGDIARWRDPLTGAAARAEHQLNAAEQAQSVAHHIITGESSPPVLPFFWSDLYGTKIQAFGRFAASAPLVSLVGEIGDERFVAASVVPSTEGDRVTGVVGWNLPRDFRAARSRVGTVLSTTSHPANQPIGASA